MLESLKHLRKGKGLTLKEVGEAVGVAESTMSQYENGNRQPDFETLLKLSEFFGTSTDTLLRGKEPQQKESTPAEAGAQIEPLSDAEREVLTLFRAAPPSLQDVVLAALEAKVREE